MNAAPQYFPPAIKMLSKDSTLSVATKLTVPLYTSDSSDTLVSIISIVLVSKLTPAVR